MSAPDRNPSDRDRGLPRPRAWFDGGHRDDRTPGLLPKPWILGPGDVGSWTTFDAERSAAAHQQRRCQVCGEQLGAVTVLLTANPPTGASRRETSGPPTHLRCALLSARHCPHLAQFRDDQTIGWVHVGPGRGYQAWGSGSAGYDPDDFGDDGPFCSEVEVVAGAYAVTLEQLRNLATDDPLAADPFVPAEPTR